MCPLLNLHQRPPRLVFTSFIFLPFNNNLEKFRFYAITYNIPMTFSHNIRIFMLRLFSQIIKRVLQFQNRSEPFSLQHIISSKF